MNNKTRLDETFHSMEDNAMEPRVYESIEERRAAMEAERKRKFEEARIRQKQLIRKVLCCWLINTPFVSFLDAIKSRVLGQEEVERVVANIYNYIRVIADGKKPNHNMLLAAPSGCGKTEIFRALRDYFSKEIPGFVVAQVDMTQITEQGFKGSDADEIVAPLLKKWGWNGVGLIFLDEFDKKLIPSYSGGGSDVNLAVQHQILTLLEGRIATNKQGDSVNTENTMFIGLGAYDRCRRNAQKESKMGIGFGAVEEKRYEYYNPITREDMIKIGASYELLGRFSVLVNFHKLSSETIDVIINRKLEEAAETFGYKVTVDDDYRRVFYKMADSKYGCRMLGNTIHEEVLSLYSKSLRVGANPYEYEFILDGSGDNLLYVYEGLTSKEIHNIVHEFN